MKEWSKAWKSSVQKRKQRKYTFKAPLHIKHRLISAHLSKELKTQYGVRSIPVRTGDSVKIMAGQFKSQSGKVTKVSLARMRVYIDGIGVKRSDDTLATYPVHPSNVMITKLDTTDKARMDKLATYKGGKKKDGEN